MASRQKKLDSANAAEWLASAGFIFPSSLDELQRLDDLLGPVDSSVTGKEVDPERILGRNLRVVKSDTKSASTPFHAKMVAADAKKLPVHIALLLERSSKGALKGKRRK